MRGNRISIYSQASWERCKTGSGMSPYDEEEEIEHEGFDRLKDELGELPTEEEEE